MTYQASHNPTRTAADVKAEADRVLDDINNIKGQIERAKVRRIETGAFADPAWYQRAKHALRYKQAAHQKLLLEYGMQRKAERAQKSWVFEEAFIDVARQILPEAVYKDILSRTFAAVNGAQADAA